MIYFNGERGENAFPAAQIDSAIDEATRRGHTTSAMVTFECLFAFLVLSHGRRQLLWFAVTRHPTAEWLAQQIVEAFPWDTAPRYLIRDNDGAYGQAFTNRVRTMGIRDRPISPEVALAKPIC